MNTSLQRRKTLPRKNWVEDKSDMSDSETQNENNAGKQAVRAKIYTWKEYNIQCLRDYQKKLKKYGLGSREVCNNKANIDITLKEALTYIYSLMNKGKTQLRGPDGFRMAAKRVYPFLESLFQHKDFHTFAGEGSGVRFSEFSEKPTLLDSPLYYVSMQEDPKMLEFLIRHVDCDASYHKGLYDAVLQYYLYMKLPDWGALTEISGKQGELLDAIDKQADLLGVKRSPVLRTLFEAGFPSKYRKLPLKYSEVHIVRHPGTRKGYHFVEGRKDWSAASQGNGYFGFYHKDSDMIRALTESGSFYPFTCECGYPCCAGIFEPVQCLKTSTGMRWYKPYPRPMSCIAFDPKPVLAELERALTEIKEELTPEWTTDNKDDYDMDFPYGILGEIPFSFKKDLALCRRRLKQMEPDQR